MMTLWPLALLLACLATATAGPATRSARAAELRSPDGQVVVTFAVADVAGSKRCPVWGMSYGGRTVISPSRLGLEIEGAPLLAGLEIVGETASAEDRTWRPVYGERSLVRERYRQASFEFREVAPPARRLRIDLRAYDEGAALRYTLLPGEGGATVRIAAERTEFRVSGDPTAWAVYSAQGTYEKVPLSALKPGCERPLVLRLAEDLYAAVGEAGLVDFARMKLAPLRGVEGPPYTEGTELVEAGVVSSLSGPVEAALSATSPWRFVLVARSPGGLLERNDLLLNLNEPSAIEDPSWIRPGKVIREVTLSTAGGKACVDFAARHGLQYVEYDAGWYGPEDSDDADATTVTLDPRRSKGPLDLPAVIRYARERGIGIVLYVNRRALERQLDRILPLYREWGVVGVKYGFVQVGSQRWTAWLHEAVRKAAAHRLMVDVHDEYRPTGFSRTYPNLMTQEGIAGDETSPSNELTLTILFTRMLAGAGDNTICYYDRRVAANASHAFQLAKAVCFYSPWQFLFWYDRPLPADAPGGVGPLPANVIGEEPELEFFATVPTVWDDTRVIHGAIGEYAVLARRSGERWFLGCMNAVRERTLRVPLDFLDEGREYLAHVYADDPSVPTRTRVRIDRLAVSSTSVLEVSLSARGGQAIRIEPVR
jgi:alpha-glucosidase